MKARLKNPAMIVPEAMAPLTGLGKLLQNSPIPAKTLGLVNLRVSQINGCAVCIDGQIKKMEETPQRMAAIAVWHDAPFFSEPERAALALAEAVTRIGDAPDRVPDAVWAEAARHYDEAALAWLVLDVAVLNMYNRLNVSTRQVAGTQDW
jgi:AhpD family alkylhydroperoxidase